ncbi:MAG: type VI secretion system-associated protein TagF [Gammaproteobacteria bacterium]
MENSGVGFFGKLPTLGDFVSRRLPRQFIDPWDQWLQSSMRASQEIHGDQWLSLFLVSPFWRFAISPGIFGDTAWAGVVMPSVDRVGRYYPLTLAQAIAAAQMTDVFLSDCPWFGQLETAALSVLAEPFDLEHFDQSLLNILPPDHYAFRCDDLNNGSTSSSSKSAFHCELDHLEDSDRLFPRLAESLLNKFLRSYSFWCTEDIQHGQVQFLCFEGMPPVDAYANFLKGQSEYNSEFCAISAIAPPLHEHEEGNEPTLPNAKSSQSNHSAVHWQSFGITEVGNRRKHNEDAMLNAPENGLWIVADGMGGHLAGDLASQRIVTDLAKIPGDVDLEKQVEWVSHSLQRINEDLCRIANDMHSGAVVGSTVVAMLARGRECAVIWAGDSRLYRSRAGKFEQLTHDHTLLDELITFGKMNREEATQTVSANVITRAVGGHESLELDVIRFSAEPGDRYLLCSDGLDKELNEKEITERMSAPNCQLTAEGLIGTALNRDAIDNITVVVVECMGSESADYHNYVTIS